MPVKCSRQIATAIPHVTLAGLPHSRHSVAKSAVIGPNRSSVRALPLLPPVITTLPKVLLWAQLIIANLNKTRMLISASMFSTVRQASTRTGTYKPTKTLIGLIRVTFADSAVLLITVSTIIHPISLNSAGATVPLISSVCTTWPQATPRAVPVFRTRASATTSAAYSLRRAEANRAAS